MTPNDGRLQGRRVSATSGIWRSFPPTTTRRRSSSISAEREASRELRSIFSSALSPIVSTCRSLRPTRTSSTMHRTSGSISTGQAPRARIDRPDRAHNQRSRTRGPESRRRIGPAGLVHSGSSSNTSSTRSASRKRPLQRSRVSTSARSRRSEAHRGSLPNRRLAIFFRSST